MQLSELIKIGIWAIKHEDEILTKLPPEEQPAVILGIAKMREGLHKLTEFIEEISKEKE